MSLCQYKNCKNPAKYYCFNADQQCKNLLCENCSKNFVKCFSCGFMTEGMFSSCDRCLIKAPGASSEPIIDKPLAAMINRADDMIQRGQKKIKSFTTIAHRFVSS